MAISGISAVTTAPRPPAPPSSGRAVFTAAERYLGMSSSQLRDALGSGKTMATLATERGLSTEGLIGAMSSAIAASQPGIDPGRATEVATRFAGAVPPAASGGRGRDGSGAAVSGRGEGLLMSLNGAARGSRPLAPATTSPRGVGETDDTGEAEEATESDATDEAGETGGDPASLVVRSAGTDAASRSGELEVSAGIDPRANLYQRLASVLGVDSDSLRQVLSHGVSIGELASARGVERAQVATAIEESLRAGGQGEVRSRSGELADLLLTSSLGSGSLFSRSA